MFSPPKAHRSGVEDYHNCLDIDYFHTSSTNLILKCQLIEKRSLKCPLVKVTCYVIL